MDTALQQKMEPDDQFGETGSQYFPGLAAKARRDLRFQGQPGEGKSVEDFISRTGLRCQSPFANEGTMAFPMLIAEAVSVSPSPRMIVELNLRHYRDLLKTETDPSKQRIIAKLLAEEEAKLAKLMQRRNESDEHH